jgi:uncharacterized protein (TIGR00297 family)
VIDLQELIPRGLAGAVAAGAVTGVARRRGMLSPEGQGMAFTIGVLAAAAGWAWALLLIAFFVSSTGLTIWRAEDKRRWTMSTMPQVSGRTARQVAANGGVFALFLLLNLRGASPRWQLAALGALAAANADTWATEIGVLLGGIPRSIVTWQRVALGMSGGITALGTLAGVAGALFIAALAALMLPALDPRTLLIVMLAGTVGMLSDSIAGATVQARRYCDRCREWTERRVHPCGYRTTHRHGFTWMTNDTVNAIGAVIGACTAIALHRLLRG